MLFEVYDKNKKVVEPQLFLALPNKTIIAKLNEAFNKKYEPSINNLSEMSFDIPYKLDINHDLTDNPNIENLRYKYLIKLVLGHMTEWFIIDQVTDTVEEDQEFLNVHCFSLGYELVDKLLIEYEVTSYNLEEMFLGKLSDNMPGILANTNWSLGYVDSDFAFSYRSLKVSSKNVLDCVFDIVDIFNAVVVWDTDKRKLNFYKPENIGVNRGLTVSYGKYLQTLSKENNTEDFVTRLKVFGKDKISINRVNPTGTNYVEDFSYFMFPFERDENKNVINHSHYMSDELCHAILDYQDKVENAQGQFETFLSQKESLEISLTERENELTNLQIELDVILDNLFVAQTHGDDDSDLRIQRQQKETDISNKEDDIEAIEAQISNIDSQINSLQTSLKIENNFSSELIQERNQFIVEKEWRAEAYIDDQELYEDAIKKLEELRQPKTVINIDIINFLEVIDEQENWDKLNLGDTVTIKYEHLNIKAKAKIIGVNYDYENSTIELIIANVTNINSQEEQWYKMLKKSISSSTQIDMNMFRWDRTEEDLGIVDQIINNMWNDVKNELNMAFNETVIIDRRGITIIDPTNPLNLLRATSGILAISSDGGNTFKHAITGEGLIREKMCYGLIKVGDIDAS